MDARRRRAQEIQPQAVAAEGAARSDTLGGRQVYAAMRSRPPGFTHALSPQDTRGRPSNNLQATD